jgi:hypothetical protein
MGDRVVIVDWFRADNSRRMRRVLMTGATCLTLGGLVIAVSFLTHQPELVREWSAAAGIVMVAGSAAFTAVSMQAILREDVSIVLRTDGVAVQDGSLETIVAWADLDGVHWEETPASLVIERRGAEPLVVAWRPARISGPALAARIVRDKQRAEMGLLR